MNAAELREALDLHRKNLDKYEQRILDAARTIALPILEADSELVERVAKALFNQQFPGEKFGTWETQRQEIRDHFTIEASAVLTAITSAEETSGP